MTRAFRFISNNEADTRRLGDAMAAVLAPGTTVALIGTLGAGKTRLVQAVATALGAAPGSVVSPTFVLIQEYDSDPTVYHFDAYRLQREAEFADLGPEEYFDGQGICFVEWADRVEARLPDDRVDVRIEVTGPERREFSLVVRGRLDETLLERLEVELM